MKDNFNACMEIIFKHEGGYVDHPRDPGGATNLGITHFTLADWRGQRVTKADVKALTKTEAKEIYRANYWHKLQCDDLPAGVDLVAFDMGVNAGPGRAARMLQKLVDADQDGAVGPITLTAVSNYGDAAGLVDEYSDERLAYYKRLRHWDAFGRGWTRRTEETRAAALDMAAKPISTPELSTEWPRGFLALIANILKLFTRKST